MADYPTGAPTPAVLCMHACMHCACAAGSIYWGVQCSFPSRTQSTLQHLPCCTASHAARYPTPTRFGCERIQGKLGFAKCVREHLKDARNRRVAIGRAPARSAARAHTHMLAHGARRYPLGSSLAVFAWARGAARSAWGHVSSALGAVLTRPPETYVLLAGHAAAAEVCALWCAQPRWRGGTWQLARGARALRRTHPFRMAVGVLSGYSMRGLRGCGWCSTSHVVACARSELRIARCA